MSWYFKELIVIDSNNVTLLDKSKKAGGGDVCKSSLATEELYNIVSREKAFKIFWSGPVTG